MENLLTEKLSKQHEAKENTHVPMTVQEACAYLKMPLSTFYYKVKKVVFQKVCLCRSLQILQICKYNNSCFQIHTPRRVDLIFVL